jgi:hypothetical protein
MLRATPLLAVVAIAGFLAAAGLGSAPAPARSHPLRIGALHASFRTAICKTPKQKRCVKPRRVVAPTKTVTRVRTVTRSITTTQTTTTIQTATVTTTVQAGPPPPRVGQYAGRTQNGNQIHFVVGGTAGALTLNALSVDEVDATCTLAAQGGITGYLTIYDVSFPDTLPVDAGGHFAGAASETWDDGSYLTISIAGDVVGSQGGGTMSTNGKLSDGEGNFWDCATGQTTWFAAGA